MQRKERCARVGQLGSPPRPAAFAAAVADLMAGAPRPRGAPIGKSPAAALRAGRGGLGGGRLAPAWGADVVSSNVVGYQKLTIYPTWTMIANPFLVVGDNDVADLQGMIVDMETNGKASGSLETADNLQIWTGTTYKNYYYYTSGGELGPTYDNKWYDAENEDDPTIDELPAGYGAWFKNATGATKQLTIAGEVSKAPVEVSINPTWTMIANPYPADLPLNGSIDWVANGSTASDSLETADNIQIWTGGTYKTYYLYTSGGELGPTYDNKWYDAENEDDPTTDVIPSGSAAWYKNASGTIFTITLTSPIAD